MATKYIKSNNIFVYPSAYRTNDSIDPEARLHTEKNITSASGAASKGIVSYIKSQPAAIGTTTISGLEFFIEGYYFKIKQLNNSDFAEWKNKIVYASIKLSTNPLIADYNTQKLLNLKNSSTAELDDPTSSETKEFCGLRLSTGEETGEKTGYDLALFKIDNSGNFIKIESSFFTEDASHIKSASTDGVAITNNLVNGTGTNSIKQLNNSVANTATGQNAIAFGEGIIAGNKNQLAIGQYNLEQTGLFIIGRGADSDHRANVFTVSETGSTTIYDKLRINNGGALIKGETLLTTGESANSKKIDLNNNGIEITGNTKIVGTNISLQDKTTNPDNFIQLKTTTDIDEETDEIISDTSIEVAGKTNINGNTTINGNLNISGNLIAKNGTDTEFKVKNLETTNELNFSGINNLDTTATYNYYLWTSGGSNFGIPQKTTDDSFYFNLNRKEIKILDKLFLNENVLKIGANNEVNAGITKAYLFGDNLKAAKKGQVVLGQYNAENLNAAFIIGGGTSSAPKNLFELDADGTLYTGKQETSEISIFKSGTDYKRIELTDNGIINLCPVVWTDLNELDNSEGRIIAKKIELKKINASSTGFDTYITLSPEGNLLNNTSIIGTKAWIANEVGENPSDYIKFYRDGSLATSSYKIEAKATNISLNGTDNIKLLSDTIIGQTTDNKSLTHYGAFDQNGNTTITGNTTISNGTTTINGALIANGNSTFGNDTTDTINLNVPISNITFGSNNNNTVGAANKFIYLSNGKLTTRNSSLGNENRPLYINSDGAFTQCQTNFGTWTVNLHSNTSTVDIGENSGNVVDGTRMDDKWDAGWDKDYTATFIGNIYTISSMTETLQVDRAWRIKIPSGYTAVCLQANQHSNQADNNNAPAASVYWNNDYAYVINRSYKSTRNGIEKKAFTFTLTLKKN